MLGWAESERVSGSWQGICRQYLLSDFAYTWCTCRRLLVDFFELACPYCNTPGLQDVLDKVFRIRDPAFKGIAPKKELLEVAKAPSH